MVLWARYTMVWRFVALFYGLDHGLPLVIAGTFTAVLKNLPNVQKWGHYITCLSGSYS